MKPLIIQLLETKGITVPSSDYNQLEEIWKSAQLQQKVIDNSLLAENDIAFKTIPGGDHVDE